MSRLPLAGLAGLLATAGLAVGAQKPPASPDRQAAEFFESRVRPLLHRACFDCHSDKQQMGGVRLDSLAAMLRGNSGGPVLVPGAPEKSRIVEAIRYDGKVKMPPSGKLKSEEIEALAAWIGMGAPWPGARVSDAAREAARSGQFVTTDEQRRHWAFRPVRRPPVPTIQQPRSSSGSRIPPATGSPAAAGRPRESSSGAATRARTSPHRQYHRTRGHTGAPSPAAHASTSIVNPIDAFILARLQQKGLRPAPRADRRTLIRRATFDLTGLPPTPEEVEAFVSDRSPDAWAKVVDRLLASPRYGERWGRYWLDVARYADTKGYLFTQDRVYHNAYTYRDYVIRAFNEDLPFDRFIVEQLAADCLNLGEDRRPLAATGFITVGRRFLNNMHDIIDDRIDVVTRGFLALTVNCARCHDHKFDPVSTRDYYSLYGIFASSKEQDPPPPITPDAVNKAHEAHAAEVARLQGERDKIVRQQVESLRAASAGLPEPARKALGMVAADKPVPDEARSALEPHFPAEAASRVADLGRQIARLEAAAPPRPQYAMALRDLETPATPHVFIRGNPNNKGPEVPRQFLEILAGPQRKPFTQGSGRLELANAIADPRNPLTARVIVNRIWLGHFGQGLVRTPSDFGTRGDRPTLPELLDWLAAELVNPTVDAPARGVPDPDARAPAPWSLKRMHRLIMLSEAYQRSSTASREALAADPENRLLTRMNRRRLDLEAMRDSVLAVAGRLDLQMGGPAVDLLKQPFPTRRTVYGFIERQNLPGFFRTFDFASPDATVGQRHQTTIPQQALFMMNSPFIVEQARHIVRRQEVRAPGDEAARVRGLYRIVYARNPTPAEAARAAAFVRSASVRQVRLEPGQGPREPMDPWEQLAQVLLMSNEFFFVD